MDKGEIKIEYCPTEYMLADYFTKPLQGKSFREMRKVIMGYEPLNHLKNTLTSTKERVEERANTKNYWVDVKYRKKRERISKSKIHREWVNKCDVAKMLKLRQEVCEIICCNVGECVLTLLK